MEQNTLLTNDVITAVIGFIIVALGSGLIGCLLFIFKRVMNEIKSYREDSLAQRTEFNDALNNKFKAVNFYMKQTDKIQMKQEEKINIFHDHAREVKAKLLSHDEKFDTHNKMLFQHDLEIGNLKKAG